MEVEEAILSIGVSLNKPAAQIVPDLTLETHQQALLFDHIPSPSLSQLWKEVDKWWVKATLAKEVRLSTAPSFSHLIGLPVEFEGNSLVLQVLAFLYAHKFSKDQVPPRLVRPGKRLLSDDKACQEADVVTSALSLLLFLDH